MSQKTTSAIRVQSLLLAVQRAFIALVPIANDLGVPWREPENYSDWDAVANGVFEGFVLEAIRSSTNYVDCVSLIDYDKRVIDYSQYSYVAIRIRESQLPLVCLQTDQSPFDTCLVAELGPAHEVTGHLRVPFSDCEFVVVTRLQSGQETLAETIAW